MNKLISSALALALSAALVGTAVPAHAEAIPAPVGADPAPVASAAAYLTAQTESNNIIKTYYSTGPTTFDSYDDYGLTIDAGFALDAVGGQTAKLAAITTALQANVGNYNFGGGSLSKMAAFLLSQGLSNTTTADLVIDIETNHISGSVPTSGRLVDAGSDFNSPLTQAFAASALNNAGSVKANPVLYFLLDQQCTAGFFRAAFSAKDAVDQTCDGATTPTASVDTTGLVLLMLKDQKSKPVVRNAINDALNWLVSVQAANGSFNSGNANSTGLAGWALGLYGRTADATEAAGWLRGHQLANAGGCTPYAAADQGAITVDDPGYADAASGALNPEEHSLATRATTQALPALLRAPGGANAGATTVTGPTGFVPAGSVQNIAISGAPGNTVCVSKGGTPTKVVLPVSGNATVPVTLPATTTTLAVSTVDAGGESDSLSIIGLAKTTLDVTLAKATVAKGATVVVKVSGLAGGETVTVIVGDKKVDATAKANGKAKVKVPATKAGKTKVKAVGAFKNRKGKASLTVTA